MLPNNTEGVVVIASGPSSEPKRGRAEVLRVPKHQNTFRRPSRGAASRAWLRIALVAPHVAPDIVTTERRPVVNANPREALDLLTREWYDELRVVARRQLAVRAGGGTLSTTGLVHEAWLKLRAQDRISWKDEMHFMALASLAMRHVLVDRAKARFARKRDGFQLQHSLDDAFIPSEAQPELLLQLNDAIDRLAAVDLRLAQVVDCRFFGGLSDQEIASAMGVTTRTVQRDWLKARMLLRRAMAP